MSGETCWTLVEDAARGHPRSRDDFAELYLPVVEAYLRSRWSGSPLAGSVDDAAQDIFVDLLKPNGALTRARRDHGTGGFRAFLFGIARNVALRHEQKHHRAGKKSQRLASTASFPAADDKPDEAFDRAWAQAIMRTARARHAADAEERGEAATGEVELLRLRFQEGLPIREIAARWERDAAGVHRLYGRARQAFAAALYDTLAVQSPGTPAEIKRECARLLALLS